MWGRRETKRQKQHNERNDNNDVRVLPSRREDADKKSIQSSSAHLMFLSITFMGLERSNRIKTKLFMVKTKRSCNIGKDINRSAETLGRYICWVMITSMLFFLIFFRLIFYSSKNKREKKKVTKHFPSHYSSCSFYWYQFQEKEEIMFFIVFFQRTLFSFIMLLIF